jgi:hypothetical protein
MPLRTSPAASYLFSIPTSSGTLTEATGHHHLTLRLTGARDYLTRFTDRPLRQASVVANADFARRFKTYFATSDPNAVLTYTPTGDQIPVSIVLTIDHPHWDAPQHTWAFSATRIRKQSDNLPGTTIHITPPHIPNPRSFTHATLLIDDSGVWVWRGCAFQTYAQCPGADLTTGAPGVDLNNQILNHANLAGADLTDDYLINTQFNSADLIGTQLADATLINGQLSGAQLNNANLEGAIFSNAVLTHADLTGADLQNAVLGGRGFCSPDPVLQGANLSDANLTNANLTGACLAYANFSGVNLTGANLTDVPYLTTVRVSAATIFCDTTLGAGLVRNDDC